MHGTRPAEGAEYEVAGVVTALDRQLANSRRHRSVDDANHALRCLFDGKAKWVGQLVVDGAACRLRIDLHVPAEKRSCRQTTEHEIGIGDGWLGPTASVARWAWSRPGRAWPHAQRAARIDPAEATPAGAHGMDVQHRDSQWQAAHLGFAGEGDLSLVDHRHVKTRSAHVGGDQVVARMFSGNRRPGNHASRGSRKHRLDALPSGHGRGHDAAV